MPLRLEPAPSFKDLFTLNGRTIAGMFLDSGDAGIAEICAGAGLDYLLIDAEHGPVNLAAILAQLRAIASYPVVPVVRVPTNDPVIIKQVLDLGAQSLIVPMVNTAEEARQAVAATRYAPAGVRGVGGVLVRSARWNRVPDYLARANALVSLLVQIESAEAVENAAEIAGTDGIDGVFIGPSDLAATMGLLGQQDHPEVVASVVRTIAAVKRAGKIIGVNAFVEAQARQYIAAGADFVNVGADVALIARGTEALVATYIGERHTSSAAPASY
ncbi:4-hydroxy-2-oxo-heptane-1,7-dioate aldolase [Zafaria cholistanensis]|uniref:4-hydroxy-2-oxo-heptane-1,7-dioate aldolase n=1 Tax=Zafaria cholistanensis TaxID=1682741 RepID=A0A5A7NTZ8_9MICC|nr:aldolase/citrate lyase family protein [Zafaria cholistanensis]GER23288.1 4-hydroxy-2-oxo-heptane-1,7-dioate aldolase [Zafaria cholistanensis]